MTNYAVVQVLKMGNSGIMFNLIISMFFIFVIENVGGDPKFNPMRGSMKNEDTETKKMGFRLWSEGPNFDTELPQDVSGVVGQAAYLTCRVFDRENRTISWIRHKDLHILTVGRYTYTADLRYQSIYNPSTDEWILQIKYLQKKDSGMYECQVSTQPVRSFFVRLNILDELPSDKLVSDQSSLASKDNEKKVPVAVIEGGSEVHVESGSTLNLTCVVKHSTEQPHYLLWYHKDQTIDYMSPRGGISVMNSESDSGGQQTSTLLLYQVEQSDSGKYSCRPSNAELTSIEVYIIEDEHQENLKSLSSSCGLIPSYSLLLLSIFCCRTFSLFFSFTLDRRRF